MVNNVAGAKLTEVLFGCVLRDVEIVEKGITVVSEVQEDGIVGNSKENDYNDSFVAYYYCNNCGADWTITRTQSQDQAWKLVKEHLDG